MKFDYSATSYFSWILNLSLTKFYIVTALDELPEESIEEPPVHQSIAEEKMEYTALGNDKYYYFKHERFSRKKFLFGLIGS